VGLAAGIRHFILYYDAAEISVGITYIRKPGSPPGFQREQLPHIPVYKLLASFFLLIITVSDEVGLTRTRLWGQPASFRLDTIPAAIGKDKNQD
jgi:hypothetical protein